MWGSSNDFAAGVVSMAIWAIVGMTLAGILALGALGFVGYHITMALIAYLGG